MTGRSRAAHVLPGGRAVQVAAKHATQLPVHRRRGAKVTTGTPKSHADPSPQVSDHSRRLVPEARRPGHLKHAAQSLPACRPAHLGRSNWPQRRARHRHNESQASGLRALRCYALTRARAMDRSNLALPPSRGIRAGSTCGGGMNHTESRVARMSQFSRCIRW